VYKYEKLYCKFGFHGILQVYKFPRVSEPWDSKVSDTPEGIRRTLGQWMTA
jgi:hypothetical protein